mgnify:CR=1 FL=1
MKSLKLRSLAVKTMILSTMTLGTPKVMATEKDLYDFLWLDPDKKVYVLQNKVHKKEAKKIQKYKRYENNITTIYRKVVFQLGFR